MNLDLGESGIRNHGGKTEWVTVMFSNKKCTKCSQPATTKITRRENGDFEDIYLCDAHASEESKYQKPATQMSDILQSILKQEVGSKVRESEPTVSLICDQCGLTYETYRQNLILGCSICYESFRDYLAVDLRRFHGEVRHCGRNPGGGSQPSLVDESVAQAGEPFVESLMQLSGTEMVEASTLPAEAVELTDKDYRNKKERLERSLEISIRKEDFLEAAKLRDRIRELDELFQSQDGPDESL